MNRLRKVGENIIRPWIKLLTKLAPWHFLIASIAEIGWGLIARNDNGEDDLVDGLIIGTDEFINKHLDKGAI